MPAKRWHLRCPTIAFFVFVFQEICFFSRWNGEAVSLCVAFSAWKIAEVQLSLYFGWERGEVTWTALRDTCSVSWCQRCTTKKRNITTKTNHLALWVRRVRSWRLFCVGLAPLVVSKRIVCALTATFDRYTAVIIAALVCKQC